MKTRQVVLLAAVLFVGLISARGQVMATQRAGFGLPAGQVTAPNTPGGGLVVGKHIYASDAVNGLRHYIPADATNPDPVHNGILVFDSANDGTSLGGTELCIFFCHVGQVAYDGNQTVYVASYDHAKGQPGSVTFPGVSRIGIAKGSGALTYQALLVPKANLGSNQTTSIALGPDGNVYVGFLKNGNVVRIVNPTLDPSNSAQIVQSVGTAPNGRAVRSMAFVGNDLYLATVDGLAVITDAVAKTCLGGCKGVTIQNGFSDTAHVGITTDGINRLYLAINGHGVWRYTISSGSMQLVSTGGVDPTTGAEIAFAFVGGNSNLINLDHLGNLWIGDDSSDGVKNFSGRLWFISAGQLASTP